MPIYPDKKEGALTGWFRVELQRGKARARKRFHTLEEAKAWELQTLADWTSGATPVVMKERRFNPAGDRPSTLAQCIAKADRRLWRGTTVDSSNMAMLYAMQELFGGSRHIDSISIEDVDDLVDDLRRKSKAKATINHYLSSLNVFLAWTIERSYRTTPAIKMTWQDKDQGRIRWITDEEEATLIDLLPERTSDLVTIGIETGMRRSEILSLEPTQLEPTWVRLWKTKSKCPRSIPIDEATRAKLSHMLEIGMPSAAALRYDWDQARKAMGLEDDPWFVFHATRHTCATRLVNANVNLRVIQKFMGHKNIQTTIRYAHVQDETLSDALIKRTQHESAPVREYHLG